MLVEKVIGVIMMRKECTKIFKELFDAAVKHNLISWYLSHVLRKINTQNRKSNIHMDEAKHSFYFLIRMHSSS